MSRGVGMVGVPVASPLEFKRTVTTATAPVSGTTLPVSVTVVASATPHAKGAWVEANASTAIDTHMILIVLPALSVSGTDTSMLLDIGIGAAAAEVVVAPDLGIGFHQAGGVWEVPVFIPKGSRIALRSQSAVASKSIAVNFQALGQPSTIIRAPAPYTVAIGSDTATSRGVTVIPGATGAKGAWSELTASCPVPLAAMGVGMQGNSINGMQGGNVLVDIGVGASGSEVVVISNLSYLSSNSENLSWRSLTRLYGVNVPKGARIAARCSNSAGSTAAFYVDAMVMGVPA